MSLSGLARLLARTARFGAGFVRGIPEHLRGGGPDGLSLARRLAEQAALLVTGGVGADDYYRYRLDRRDVPWERKLDYVGHVERWRWMNAVNPPAYRFLSEDKLVFKRYMAGAGVPVPELLGVFGADGRAETGEPLRTPRELEAWLLARDIANVVLKPATGTRGVGVEILGPRQPGAARWRRAAGGDVGVDEVVATIRARPEFRSFVIERRVWPHPELTRYSAEIAHTVRAVTVLEDEVEVVVAVLRIPTGRTPTDNFSQGNVAAPIDLRTGRLGTGVFKRERDLGRLTAHPVTGAPIAGQPVPDWDRAVAMLRRAAAAVPADRVLAWDLALTPDGPVMLEANDIWDPDAVQIGPDRGVLGTPLADYLRRRGHMKLVGLGLRR